MNCANCGAANEAGRKFCLECGEPLSRRCPTCGAANAPQARFCGECGTRLTSEGSAGGVRDPPTAAPPVAERRVVSVLFTDLVGFTPFSADRDAEDVRETLSRYFDAASEVIARYGGTVEKFIGDAVMAVWGAPIAHEDDAERAVRAALDLLDVVPRLEPGIHARAAVLTGEAAVTVGATNQGMVAGDLVNTASRLQGTAPPDSVLVDEPTRRASGRAIAFEEAGPQTLKGKSAPVFAWRALRVVAERGGRNRADRLEAPFVGRDEELRLLKDLFHATGRHGRARLVSIVGPAGIGKTRLAWEFEKYLDGLVETVWWHRGRSPAYGDGVTFWALGEMVRSRAGLLEADDEATIRVKIAEITTAHLPDPDERRWVELALLALLGVGEPSVSADELLAAWRTFFERLAANATVVLVFEDLHWADDGLLDFIDGLLEWSRALPIYVVTLARPELVERRPEWGADKRNFTSLHLEPLAASEMQRLLVGMAPGLPDPAARAIVARAEGIPLYAVEIVRMLVADGRLAVSEGAFRATDALAEVAIPESLTSLIAARLDGLPSADHALLEQAAVLGQSFTIEGLAAVSGRDSAALAARLRALVRQEFLTLDMDPRSPERGQYVFAQGLTREVAYNTLSKRDRKTLHLAAARYFETLGTDELAGALAGHYLAAHRSASPGREAEAVAVQAKTALRAAADRAAALGAHGQSVLFLEQALAIATDPAERAQLLGAAGVEATAGGLLEAARRLLNEAIAAGRTAGDRVATVSAIGALGRALLQAYRPEEALALLEPAAAEFADLESAPVGIALGGERARALFLAGRGREAIEVADKVLEAAEHADLVPIVADALVTAGTALADLGRPTQGLAMVRAGQEVAEEEALTHTLMRACINRMTIEIFLDPRAALEAGRAGLEVARRLGRRNQGVQIVNNAITLAVMLGEWPWATAQLDRALDDELDPADRLTLLSTAVEIRARQGEAVGELLREIDDLAAARSDPVNHAVAVSAGAEAAFAQGRMADAVVAWKQAEESGGGFFVDTPQRAARAALWHGDVDRVREFEEEIERRGIHGRAAGASRRAIRAGLEGLAGRKDESIALYRQAIDGWQALGCVWEQALCAIDMAVVLGPGEPDVQAAAEAGREILLRLGARPFLDRLDALMAGDQVAGPTNIRAGKEGTGRRDDLDRSGMRSGASIAP